MTMKKIRLRKMEKKLRENSLFKTFHGTLMKTLLVNTSANMVKSLTLRSHKDPMANLRDLPLLNSATLKMLRKHWLKMEKTLMVEI
jgi:hypothetical protein